MTTRGEQMAADDAHLPAAEKPGPQGRRTAHSTKKKARLTKTCRRMRTNAHNASARASEAAAAAEPTPTENRGRMATIVVVSLVAMKWLRRRRDANMRSDHSR